MTNSSEETSREEYDAILRKLDALLRKHQDGLSASTLARADGSRDSRPLSVFSGAPKQVRPTTADEIPTLTEVVHLAPSMIASSSDLTVLLGQIVDSALKDANVELDNEARTMLVEALQARLFRL